MDKQAAHDPFEAPTEGETKEGVKRTLVDHYIDLEPEGKSGFAGCLIECWRDKRTGILRVQTNSGITSIYFDGGAPVFAESTDPNAFFGKMLVHLGKLTDAELTRAINACGRGRPDPFRFAEVLVEAQLLDHQSVYELLLLHACETVLTCFAFSHFRAKFGPGRDSPFKFAFSVPSLVREGIGRAYSQQEVDGIVAPWVNRRAKLRPHLDNLLEQLGLSPEEHAFLFELDGASFLGVSSQRSPLDPLETTRLVAVLILLDLVDLVDAGPELVAPRKIERSDSAV